LVGGDFGMDMDCFLGGAYKIKTKELRDKLKTAARIIIEVYKIAHAENTKGCSHSDWEEIKYKILNANKSVLTE
jgi:hypothetical protein